jgi:hypothetical protein
MGTSPIPNFGMRSPPLGGTICPDKNWNAGRSLTLHGPTTFLGARWVLTASVLGQPAQSPAPPVPPVLPPTIVEGAIPFIEDTATVLEILPPAGSVEGSTAFVEETETAP